MTKVMTIVGTRPEIIRLSETIKLLDQTVDHVLVHTGQNYDYSLNQVFFDDLGLRAPDRYMEVDTTSLGTVLGGVLQKTEEALLAERPDAVLILGDTNSSLAAVMAKRMQVPVYHMEAGNRSFDENVPEETNRRLVDHVADFNLVYTEHARRNLLAEGLHPQRILKTGSPMKEVLDAHAEAIAGSDVLARLGLEPRGYLLVSAHRQENVDSPVRLNRLLDCLEAAARATGRPALVSTHPRTRKRLDALGRAVNGVEFHEPLGFHDYNALQKSAYCVLSDSGTISEESALLDFPAVTLRDSIERPEALDTASILMTGLDPDNVVEAVGFAVSDDDRASRTPDDYRIGDCSRRTVGYILSTHARHEGWLGLHPS
jgi:UDP-N-acetylglucosamine 2-epimerase